MTEVTVNLVKYAENNISSKFVKINLSKKIVKIGILNPFHKKIICAYSHTTAIQKDSRIELFEEEIKALKDEIEALKTQDRNLEEKVWEISKEQSKCAHLDAKSSRTTLDKELISPNNSKCDMCNKMFVSEINTMWKHFIIHGKSKLFILTRYN